LPPQRIKLLASYQGCSEAGLCYSPIRKTLTLDLPVAERNASPASETDAARALIADGKLWLIAAGFFGFGLLLAFTPACSR